MLLNAHRNIHFIYVAISKQKQSETHRDLFYQIANPLNFNCEQTKFVQREREFFCTNFMNFMIATWFRTTQESILNRIKLQKIERHCLKLWKCENSKTFTHTWKKASYLLFSHSDKNQNHDWNDIAHWKYVFHIQKGIKYHTAKNCKYHSTIFKKKCSECLVMNQNELLLFYFQLSCINDNHWIDLITWCIIA